MNPHNLDVMGNPNELDNFDPNVHELLSLPNDQCFTDYHPRTAFQFPLCTSEISNATHPLVMNYESLARFFQPGEGTSIGAAGENGLPDSDCVMNSSSQSGTCGLLANNKSYGGKKRKRNKDREAEKPREVVHVRAKRGQATDSHSLAERSRREKINEKLRCLQDLVPGCYKTMGMAVMLDVITNYVRSLQNQIDFLSMKLSAASLFYDFNSDIDTVGAVQEAQGIEKLMGEGYVMPPQFHNSWPY